MTDVPPLPPPTPSAPPPAGWYPDPEGSAEQRWWDGQASGRLASATVPADAGRTDGFAIAALVLSIFGGILLSFIFAIVALGRIRSGKRERGRGMAIAALWISGAWAVLIAIVIGLAVAGVLDDENVDDYTGTKREVAAVIDRFEDAADDDGTKLCALLTREMAAAVASEKGTCDAFVDGQDGIQAELDARSIVITAEGRATALVDEDGDLLRFTFVREPGGWKIASITDATGS